MKARVKETGEMVNVRYDVHPNPSVKPYWCAVNDQGDIVDYYNDAEIEFIGTTVKPVDWEQRRYEIAKEVLANIPANYPESLETKVSIAVMRADARSTEQLFSHPKRSLHAEKRILQTGKAAGSADRRRD